jgi:GR25 family glycosyltransferase involved in LPS biosynthesis
MNTVKFYFICKNEEEKRFAKQQCDYIQKGSKNEREGGHLNVKFILNSYEQGFQEALEMVKINALFDFGVILFGNNHIYRRIYTAIHNVIKKVDKTTLPFYINIGSTNFLDETTSKLNLWLEGTVTQLFTVDFSEKNNGENLQYEPCFLSKTFLYQDVNQLFMEGYVNFPLCVTSEVYNNSNLVYFCKNKFEYIPSLSMVHYCTKKSQSIFNLLFDCVYCINLSSRPDRFLKVQHKMKLHNIEFERYNAISKSILNPFAQVVMPDDFLLEGSANKSGLLGCLLSHLGVMKTALCRGQKQILIFEDDVSIHKEAELHLQSFLKSLKENCIEIKDVDVIHFGYLPIIQKGNYEIKDVWSYRFLHHYNGSGTLLKSQHFIGCHAYAVSEKFMKAYINFYANLDVDLHEWPTNDWAIRDHFLLNEDFLCFAPCPQIFGVSPSFSDNSELFEDNVEKRIINSNFTYFDDYE